MRTTLLLLVSSLLGSPVFANAVETCCVESDIAAAFLPNVSYSREWPEDFPLSSGALDFPFIGASEGRMGAWQAVAWHVPEGNLDAGAMAAEALEGEGWRLIPEPEHSFRQLRGFVIETSLRNFSQARFCRENDGTISLSMLNHGEEQIVVLNNYREQPMNCEQTIASQQTQHGHVGGMTDFMPIVKVPSELARQHGGGHSSGNDEAESRMDVRYDGDLESLVRSFARQIEDQGWSPDSEFSSSTLSGAAWRKTTQGLNMVCLVTAMQQDDRVKLIMNVYRL